MIVGDAKQAARAWVLDKGSNVPGFSGAFFHGSVNVLPDDAELSRTSDVDVMLVLAGTGTPLRPNGLGKFVYRAVILEASVLSQDQLRTPEQVLSAYHLAGSLAAASVIADPSGHLTGLHRAVARDFAKRHWVRRRCDHASEKVLRGLKLSESDRLHDQVTAWLFPAGVLTHVLLVAGLKNPTVRRRYVAARELLAEYGHSDLYEPLLELLGFARMSQQRVEHHLAALADLFDVTKRFVRTPFPFAQDISDAGRPIAIDGSHELIARGDHREAVFWIVATWSRCLKILHHDAPAEIRDAYDDGYRRLLADLGITSDADIQRRFQQVEAFLPQVRAVADAILAANPGIKD